MKAKHFGLAGLAAAAALAGMGGPASAHHAFTLYDNGKYLPLNGTIKTWTWQNPHAMIDLEVVMPDGSTQLWSVECSAPNIIGRRGWSKASLNVGDKLPFVVHPMKDGTFHALMVSVTTTKGAVLKDKA